MQYLRDVKTLLDDSMKMIERALASENLPSIESNILLGKLAKAYELLLLGSKEHDEPTSQANNQPTAKANHDIAPPGIEANQPLLTQNDEIKPAASENSSAKNIPEHKLRVKDKPQAQNERINVGFKPIPEATGAERPATLADKFQDKQKSLNETIANQNHRSDMATKLQNKPITDLSKAIGINDKFLFTTELFDGDSTLYAETVNRLNGMGDMNEAIIYLQDNFSWKATSEAAAKFIDLVRRKFS